MQFDDAVSQTNTDMTAGELLKKLFVDELKFEEKDVPKIIFWNLAANDNLPALATDDGIIMLSGSNPQKLFDLDTIVSEAISPQEYEEKKMEMKEKAEKEKRINTWETMTQILISFGMKNGFLEEIKVMLPHTLLDDPEDEKKDHTTETTPSIVEDLISISDTDSEAASQSSSSSRKNHRSPATRTKKK
jgi:hypothetical protein